MLAFALPSVHPTPTLPARRAATSFPRPRPSLAPAPRSAILPFAVAAATAAADSPDAAVPGLLSDAPDEVGGVVRGVGSVEEFDALVEACTKADCLLVVDFYAMWCRKCKVLLPKFTRIARRYADAEAGMEGAVAVAVAPVEGEVEEDEQVVVVAPVREKGVVFAKVDINQVAGLPRREDVKRMPSFVFYRDGEKVEHMLGGGDPGVVEKKIIELVELHRAE